MSPSILPSAFSRRALTDAFMLSTVASIPALWSTYEALTSLTTNLSILSNSKRSDKEVEVVSSSISGEELITNTSKLALPMESTKIFALASDKVILLTIILSLKRNSFTFTDAYKSLTERRVSLFKVTESLISFKSVT